LLVAHLFVLLMRRCFRDAWILLGLLLLGVVCVIIVGRIVLDTRPGGRLAVMHLVGAEAPPAGSVVAVLSRDFFSIKRWGVGGWVPSTAAGLLVIVFAGAVVGAFRKNKPALLLFAVWGTVMAVMTVTGFAQFSTYQRAGWSLLLACALLAGVISEWLCSTMRWRWVWWGVPATAAVVSIAGLFFPPRHVLFASYAENTTVQLLRALSGSRVAASVLPSWKQLVAEMPPEALQSPTVVARRFAGFKDGQGDLLHAFCGKRAVTWIPGDPLPQPLARRFVWVLIDQPAGDVGSTSLPGLVMQMVQPDAVARFEERRRNGLQDNRALVDLVHQQEAQGVQHVEIPFTPSLTVHILWVSVEPEPIEPVPERDA
jgi:hypothetical protein